MLVGLFVFGFVISGKETVMESSEGHRRIHGYLEKNVKVETLRNEGEIERYAYMCFFVCVFFKQNCDNLLKDWM